MAIISAFKGIRYNTKKTPDISKVVTPPYDVISPTAQQKFYDAHENNIIRIELGKEYENDNENNNKYTRAGNYLKEWIDNDILVEEKAPALYMFEQEFQTSEFEIKTRKGLITLVKLADFSEGIVLPHEYTLSKAKVDRFNLMSTTDANISQIFSIYNSNNQVSSILKAYASSTKPEIQYKNNEGITERLWVITDSEIISKICNIISDKQLFIADGHHRYETALNYRNKLASENPSHTGNELYNYVMMTIVDMDDPGLVVFPTHRAVSIEPFDSDDFIEFARQYFNIDKTEFNSSNHTSYIPNQIKLSLEQSGKCDKAFGYYDGKGKYYYILTLKDGSATKKFIPNKPSSYRTLDVAILHSVIMEQYFKIDVEKLANQTNLTYIKDIQDALDGVNAGKFQCAFFLNPTKVDELKNVSLENEKMPQKSTYFYPKVTTGLVINKFR